MSAPAECCDCGRVVPEATGDTTLVSVKYGWRLTREKLESGETVPRWRCRACWSNYKARRAS